MRDSVLTVVVARDGSIEYAATELPFDPADRRALAIHTRLHDAGEIGGTLGLRGLTGTATRLVDAVGGRWYCWEFAANPAPAPLTAHQRRVAELAVRGRRTREIAAELGVAPETVKQHLDAAYVRLDVASRVELRQRLLDPR